MKFHEWRRAPHFSPAGFLRWALFWSLLHGALALAGARRCTSVLALTYPEGMGKDLAAMLGLGYVLTHIVFVVFVPTLVLAASLWAAWMRFRRNRAARPEAAP